MKTTVTDEAVAKYAASVRAGIPTTDLFPTRMLDCAFTEEQRQVIRQARGDRKASQNVAMAQSGSSIATKAHVNGSSPKQTVPTKIQKPKGLSKLGKMLYLQSGRCFFCGEALQEEEASIEHLNPKSRGGTSAEDNEVVCHKSLNETFGAMDLKHKFAFVLKSAGAFKCPRK